MSDVISALQGRTAEGVVTIQEMGLCGMITLRGDLADPKIAAICRDLTGHDLPAKGHATTTGETGLAWMSPDEVLILVPYATSEVALSMAQEALKGSHFLAFDVSDARAMFQLTGKYVHEILAKLAPVDLDPAHFPVGRLRRSRLGQVAAAFWKVDQDSFRVVCFRSVADYTFNLLAASAKAGPVDHLNG